MVLLVIDKSHVSCSSCLKYVILKKKLLRIICHCYRLLTITPQETVSDFQEDETKIQLDRSLIPPAENSVVSLSPFLAK